MFGARMSQNRDTVHQSRGVMVLGLVTSHVSLDLLAKLILQGLPLQSQYYFPFEIIEYLRGRYFKRYEYPSVILACKTVSVVLAHIHRAFCICNWNSIRKTCPFLPLVN